MRGDWAGTLPLEPYCSPAGPARTADALQHQTKKTEAKTSKSTEQKSVDPDPPGKVPSAIRPPAETKLVWHAVWREGCALEFASDELRACRAMVSTAVMCNGRALEHAAAHLRDDKEIVLEAVTIYGRALEYASLRLRADYDVVVAAMAQEPIAMHWAGEELRAGIAAELDEIIAEFGL